MKKIGSDCGGIKLFKVNKPKTATKAATKKNAPAKKK